MNDTSSSATRCPKEYLEDALNRMRDRPYLSEMPRWRMDQDLVPRFMEKIGQWGDPAVIDGYLEWCDFGPLSFESLFEKIGDQILSPALKPATIQKLVEETQSLYPPITVRDYCEKFVRAVSPARNDIYFHYRNIQMSQEFEAALGLCAPPFFSRQEYRRPSIWIGKEGTRSSLHSDCTDNLLVMLVGEKRLTLFPPRDHPYLYLVPRAGGGLRLSQVQMEEPDHSAFPRFADAHPIEVVLRAGEVLYLPVGWVHFVRNTQDSVMVNYWLRDGCPPALLRSRQPC